MQYYDAINIIILHLFKDYCALGFFKGALLLDEQQILSKPGENSQSVRMAKFTNVKDIKKRKTILKAYIYEAIEVEKAGIKVELKLSKNLELPEEFQHKLNSNPTLKKPWNLTNVFLQEDPSLFDRSYLTEVFCANRPQFL